MDKRIEKEELPKELTIDRIEGGKAVLSSGKLECTIPLSFLPLKSKEGDIIQAIFSADEDEKKRRELKAKEILNEILNV